MTTKRSFYVAEATNNYGIDRVYQFSNKEDLFDFVKDSNKGARKSMTIKALLGLMEDQRSYYRKISRTKAVEEVVNAGVEHYTNLK